MKKAGSTEDPQEHFKPRVPVNQTLLGLRHNSLADVQKKQELEKDFQADCGNFLLFLGVAVSPRGKPQKAGVNNEVEEGLKARHTISSPKALGDSAGFQKPLKENEKAFALRISFRLCFNVLKFVLNTL